MVQIMAWRRPGDKPLSEPMMFSFPTHICVARPQWVKLFQLSPMRSINIIRWLVRAGILLWLASALWVATGLVLLVKLPSVRDWTSTGQAGPVRTLGQPGLKSESWAHFIFWIFCFGLILIFPVILISCGPTVMCCVYNVLMIFRQLTNYIWIKHYE